MSKNDFSEIGKNIKEAVNDSLKTGDYNKLGREVGQSVNSVLEHTFEEVRRSVQEVKIETKNTKRQYPRRDSYQQPKPQQREYQERGSVEERNKPFYFPHAAKGKTSNILLTVFGSIGLFVSLILFIIFASLGIGPGAMISLGWIVGSVFMEVTASSIRKRLRRYYIYLEILKGRASCTIDELSHYIGRSRGFVVKDIRNMIQIGMFPRARITKDHKVMFTNLVGYKEYNQLPKQEREVPPVQETVKQAEPVQQDEAVIGIINEGKEYIRRIRVANVNVQDESVSEKIYRLERVVTQIIGHMENHTDQLSEIRRLLQFYLPTTVKLLDAYAEFEKHPIQGDNIVTAKQEIQNSLDMINEAFENLFNNLFEGTAMDITADISVLETMLAEEGLTDRRVEREKM